MAIAGGCSPWGILEIAGCGSKVDNVAHGRQGRASCGRMPQKIKLHFPEFIFMYGIDGSPHTYLWGLFQGWAAHPDVSGLAPNLL